MRIKGSIFDESVDRVRDKLEVLSCHAYIVPSWQGVSTPWGAIFEVFFICRKWLWCKGLR